MSRKLRMSAIVLAVAAGWALPAQAQAQGVSDDAAVRQELTEMRAQMARMAERIDTLEGQLGEARAKADAAQQAVAAIPAPTMSAKPATEVAWDGAPKFSTKEGWSFKPRGRLQVDAGYVSAPTMPNPAGQRELGFSQEFRRAYIGFDGTMPGGFGYRLEADLANSSVVLTDVYLTYKANPEVTLTVGQHKPFWGLDEMTSDLFTSFQERAPFTSAFGFERRLGVSAAYAGKSLLVQAGVFGDDVSSLNSDADNSYGVDGRVIFMPKLGGGQLHLGGSAHYRWLKDQALTDLPRYRARPFVHTTDMRFVDTGNIPGATKERGLGLEAAYVNGRFHAAAESYWQTVSRTGRANPTFTGGYAEVGMLLTDDVTAYKGGVFDRIRPKKPIDKGGLGAIQVNARYDWLDLSDGGVIGGQQRTAGVALVWVPTDYVRFWLNYGHLWVRDAPILGDGSPDYDADVVGMRAQFDF